MDRKKNVITTPNWNELPFCFSIFITQTIKVRQVCWTNATQITSVFITTNSKTLSILQNFITLLKLLEMTFWTLANVSHDSINTKSQESNSHIDLQNHKFPQDAVIITIFQRKHLTNKICKKDNIFCWSLDCLLEL